MTTINVVVLFGGKSPEHEVSVSSAREMLARLNEKDAFSFFPVRISTNGDWVAEGDVASVTTGEGTLVRLAPALGGAVELRQSITNERICSVDLVLPILHGPYGEDGVIQGYLEELGVPYVGCGVSASANAMDKDFTKRLLRADGFSVAGGITLYDDQIRVEEIQDLLELPIFVKPATGGSSIGVSRVEDWADLQGAVRGAFSSSAKVVIEPEVRGTEVEVGVLEFPDGSVKASVPAQLNGTTNGEQQFYDFDSKYHSDIVSATIPANLPPELSEQLQSTAIAVFRSLGCEGLARVDFFVSMQQVVINEVNTMPGFTSKSMFPRVWEASGYDFDQLVDILLRTSLGDLYPEAREA